jgi:hypothetical protein
LGCPLQGDGPSEDFWLLDPAALPGGLPLPVQSRLAGALAPVAGLSGLQDLSLRCVAGERGFFTSPTLMGLAE